MADASRFLDAVRWLGHAGFIIRDKLTIYVDPWKLPDGLPTADMVLLTHNHPEHCSVPDVMKVSKPQTIVVGPADAVCRFRLNQLPLQGGQSKSVLGVSVTATMAYNRENAKHARGGPWVGFLFDALGLKVFHAGDTDQVPELAALRADVALLPVAGDVMSPVEAAGLARSLEAALALPMHFGLSSLDRAQDFVREARSLGVNALLPEPHHA